MTTTDFLKLEVRELAKHEQYSGKAILVNQHTLLIDTDLC